MRDKRPDSRQYVVGRGQLCFLPTAYCLLPIAFVGSTQSLEPSGWNSFFQIGTVDLTRSIAARQAANASDRWGATAAMTTEGSPTLRRPTRCRIRTYASGKSRARPSAIRAISSSAIGPYASYSIAVV